MILLILSIVISMGLSFFCSLTEACFLSLSMADIAELAEKRPRVADMMRKLKENVQKPIAAILILNNLANIVGAAVSGVFFSDLFGHKLIGVFSFFFSLAIIQWSEFLPKTLGVIHKRKLAGLITWPLAYMTRALGPLVFVLEWINRPFQGRTKQKMSADTLNEIMLLTRSASVNKLISREQVDIVSRSIKLSQARIQDIMVGRDEIKFLSTAMTMAEALIESHIHHHTRYILVRDGNLDEIVGYVNVKDIVSALQINPTDPSLKGIARPVLTVRAALLVPELLKELTRGYQHMAVVRNDQAKTVGLVTLEDVVEAIVGDLEDEYDVLPSHVIPISEVRFLAGGGVSLATLKAKTKFDLPELPTNLNDWLCSLYKNLPPIEHAIPFADLAFIVRKIRRSKIHEVLVEKRHQATPVAIPV
ncbi:MAG: CNNM domain-containing protein [Kiritimatiellaeota bacterium]|nr:CNNM domain-containing protein [Kiritimatiellota bacterium]